MRYRFEYKDDDVARKTAKASTLRTTLGYRTGALFGFGGYVQIEDALALAMEAPDGPFRALEQSQDENILSDDSGAAYVIRLLLR